MEVIFRLSSPELVIGRSSQVKEFVRTISFTNLSLCNLKRKYSDSKLFSAKYFSKSLNSKVFNMLKN